MCHKISQNMTVENKKPFLSEQSSAGKLSDKPGWKFFSAASLINSACILTPQFTFILNQLGTHILNFTSIFLWFLISRWLPDPSLVLPKHLMQLMQAACPNMLPLAATAAPNQQREKQPFRGLINYPMKLMWTPCEHSRQQHRLASPCPHALSAGALPCEGGPGHLPAETEITQQPLCITCCYYP